MHETLREMRHSKWNQTSLDLHSTITPKIAFTAITTTRDTLKS